MLKLWQYAAIILTVFLVFIMTASGQIESVDGMSSLNMARNLIYKGTWEVAPPKYGIGGGTTDPINGKYYSGASKGYAIMMVPAVWLSKQIYQNNNFEPVKNFPLESDYLLTLLASFTNPLLSFVLFLINFVVFSYIAKNKTAGLLLALIISFTTNLWPLSKHSFPNLLVTFELAAILGSIVMWWKSKKWYWMILAGALSVFTWFSYNITVLLALFLVGYTLVDKQFYGKKISKKEFLYLGLFGIAALAIGATIFRIVGGMTGILEKLGGEGTSKDMFQAVWGMLLSPGKSISVFSPVWVLAIVTAVGTWRRSLWSRLLLVATVVYVGFYSLFDIWAGELSYGPRYLAPLIPLAGFVLAENYQKVNKKWLWGLALVGLYVQMVGVTVPFETQYQGIAVGNFNESQINNRQAQMDYWSLGEFLPKYSPVYRLKKNFIHRLILVPRTFARQPDIVFAGGATLPIDGGEKIRRVGSTIKVIINKNINIKSIKMNKLFAGIKDASICLNDRCQLIRGENENGLIEFGLYEEVDAVFGDTVSINLIGANPGYRFELKKLIIGEEEVDMGSYKLRIEDSYYNKNTPHSDDVDVLYQRYYDRKSVTNMTADFWWVRNSIYF